jgi:hypothetical protein
MEASCALYSSPTRKYRISSHESSGESEKAIIPVLGNSLHITFEAVWLKIPACGLFTSPLLY